MPVKLMSRRGFTLVELLIVIVLLGLVLTMLMKVIVGQQQFYRGAADITENRSNVRDAVDLLQGELRTLSPSNGEILGMSSTSIDFLAPIATTMVCVVNPALKQLIVPPLTLTSHAGLTSWISPPVTGDTLVLMDLGPKDGSADDKWVGNTLYQTPKSGQTCPTSSGLTATVTEAGKGWLLAVNSPIGQVGQPGQWVRQGSAIRVLRESHFELYQAGDGKWYLGFYECPGRVCSSIQPVSGPYQPATNDGTSGLTFTYYDNTGAVLDPASATARFSVARIDVTMRALSRSDTKGAINQHVDSLSTSIALRN